MATNSQGHSTGKFGVQADEHQTPSAGSVTPAHVAKAAANAHAKHGTNGHGAHGHPPLGGDGAYTQHVASAPHQAGHDSPAAQKAANIGR